MFLQKYIISVILFLSIWTVPVTAEEYWNSVNISYRYERVPSPNVNDGYHEEISYGVGFQKMTYINKNLGYYTCIDINSSQRIIHTYGDGSQSSAASLGLFSLPVSFGMAGILNPVNKVDLYCGLGISSVLFAIHDILDDYQYTGLVYVISHFIQVGGTIGITINTGNTCFSLGCYGYTTPYLFQPNYDIRPFLGIGLKNSKLNSVKLVQSRRKALYVWQLAYIKDALIYGDIEKAERIYNTYFAIGDAIGTEEAKEAYRLIQKAKYLKLSKEYSDRPL